MSLPPLSSEGNDIKDVSQSKSFSQDEIQIISPSILKTTLKSSAIVYSILKKREQISQGSSNKVRFESKESVAEFEKYLTPLEDEEENSEFEDDDLFDEETMSNTLRNEEEGSRVQLSKEFFIPVESGERRSSELAESVYNKLSSLDKVDEEKNNGPDLERPSGLFIFGLFRKITTSLDNLGQRLSSLLRRIMNVIKACWEALKVKPRTMDEEVVLVSVIYDPNLSSKSLETLSE